MALGEFKENMFDITGGEAGNARMLASIGDAHDGYLKSGFSLAQSFAQARDATKEKTRKSTIDWLTLLNEIQAGIDALEQPFKEEFGENYIDTMAQRFLSEEEYSSVETAAEREQLLYEKYLENGEIKEGFENSADAQWIKQLYDARLQINKGHELQQKLTKAHAEYGEDIPEQIVSEVRSELEQSGLASIVSFDEKTKGKTSYKIATQAVDQNHTTEVGELGNPNTLKF